MEDLYQAYDGELEDAARHGSHAWASQELVAATEQDHVVMFTDLVGFTRITAATGSRATGALLSRVLGAQIAVIEAAGGVIRNIMGDAIMASWAVDQDRDRAAVCAGALRAAFTIAAAMRRLPSPLPHRRGLAVRIGLHVGPVLLGTLYAGHAAGRTLIGDAVNIAARLQQAGRSGAAAQSVGAVRASAEFYRELTSSDRLLLPDRSVIEACGRAVPMHSSFPDDAAPPHRRGSGAPMGSRPVHPFAWAVCLDRLAAYMATA